MISQVYGGGGNSGAVYKNDFIELFNRGAQAVDVTNWSVQYASATGSSWDRTVLQGTIRPGQYYLIGEAQGAGGTQDLPRHDVSGAINLSATAGKVALVRDSTLLTTSSVSGSRIADFVGYGGANYAEGSPAGTLSNTTAAIRKSKGCTDTDNNAADFSVGVPNPRNSSSALNPCAAPVPTISAAGVVNAASSLGGPVAPGEIVTIYGQSLGPANLVPLQLTEDRRSVTTVLAGTRALFDGIPAPMIYTLTGQVSAVVPYGIAGRNTTELQIEYNGNASQPAVLSVVSTATGLFTLDSSGKGQVAALNQDNSINGPASPAAKNSTVQIYATGGGITVPSTADGILVTGATGLAAAVSAQIGGIDAEVVYAGAAPFNVAGVVQINLRVPQQLTAGGAIPVVVTIGNSASQSGATLTIEGEPGAAPGTGPTIEAKLEILKREVLPPPLPEIPNDRVRIPSDWLALVSWNIQVGSTSLEAGAPRPPMLRDALGALFLGTYQILSAQEIPSGASGEFLTTLLPGGSAGWKMSMVDTTDTMDNGFWFGNSVILRDSFPLFTTGQRDSNGRIVADATRAVHPPQVAQFQVGDFDFTLINVHLTFADGDTRESAREMGNVLDYLHWYFDQPDHDPDVIVCGDFNTPSRLSGQTGRAGLTLDSVLEADGRFKDGERRFVTTVHQATSRNSTGVPVNNYDHCVLSADTMEEFIQARRVDTAILTDSPEDPELRLTSDHFPIVAFFYTRGKDVALDRKLRIRP